MQKKFVVLFLTILLTVFNFVYHINTDTLGGLEISSEVIEPSSEILTDNTSIPRAISDSENVTITLKNPTFEELKDFILRDATSRNQFVLNKYECRHFTTDVINNAFAAGLSAGFALFGYEKGQHAVVAFNTIDRGLVFIEPQTDAIIEPRVGGQYQGQEIKEILIAW